MDHTPFIIGSYLTFALVLGWTALSPLFWRAQVRKTIGQRSLLERGHSEKTKGTGE